MTDPVISISTSGFVKLLGKLPGWLIAQKFSKSYCLPLIKSAVSNPRFEISSLRPMPALRNVEITLHNFLPFEIEVNFQHINAEVNSQGVVSFPLNQTVVIPALTSVKSTFPEIPLLDGQVQLLKKQQDHVSLVINIRWYCKSKVRSWEQAGSFSVMATIYGDKDKSI